MEFKDALEIYKEGEREKVKEHRIYIKGKVLNAEMHIKELIRKLEEDTGLTVLSVYYGDFKKVSINLIIEGRN